MKKPVYSVKKKETAVKAPVATAMQKGGKKKMC